MAALFFVFANLIYILLYGMSSSLYNIRTMFLIVGYFLLIIAPHKKRIYKLGHIYLNPVVLISALFVIVMIIHDHSISGYYSIHHVEMNAFEIKYLTGSFIPMLIFPLAVTCVDEKNSFVDSIKYWGCVYLIVLLSVFSLSSELLANRMLLLEMTDDLLSTIFLSRFAGLVVIASFVTLLFGKIGKTLKVICVSVFLIFLFSLLLLGQRGSVIGTFLGVLLLFLRGKDRKYVLYLIPLVLIAFIVLSQFEFGIFNRFEELEDSESSDRYKDYFNVWKIFSENNYLTGLGSCGYEYYTGRTYPHNIFLEHISNYGILGLFCVTVFFFYNLKHIIYILKYSENYRDKIICSSWCLFAFSALVSSSIAGQQLLYLWSTLLVMIYNEVKVYSRLKKKEFISHGKIIDK